ncbi:hypothetical protein BDN70DRAFT_938148 [Pholiota conissans]|uniref:Uncharacterized protein n=1 Tax=Pholiota conissans TaxID=109636 RepID=A0A9P5YR98_9AGAR|nr:hypothetical protein BDN70DRAFT_938148 [Pholiota conissans]
MREDEDAPPGKRSGSVVFHLAPVPLDLLPPTVASFASRNDTTHTYREPWAGVAASLAQREGIEKDLPCSDLRAPTQSFTALLALDTTLPWLLVIRPLAQHLSPTYPASFRALRAGRRVVVTKRDWTAVPEKVTSHPSFEGRGFRSGFQGAGYIPQVRGEAHSAGGGENGSGGAAELECFVVVGGDGADEHPYM